MKGIRIVDKCQSELIVHMLVRRSSHLFNLSRFDGASVDVGRLISLQARGSPSFLLLCLYSPHIHRFDASKAGVRYFTREVLVSFDHTTCRLVGEQNLA